MSPSAALFFDDDNLKAAFYETMAQVSHSVAEVKEKHYSLPFRLWKAERRLREFVASVNTRKPKFGTFPVSTIQNSVEDLKTLHRSVENLWAVSKRHGFTNRTLYAGSLNAIRRHSDEILDIAENLQLLLDPRTREIFDRTREEHLRGETVSFESLVPRK